MQAQSGGVSTRYELPVGGYNALTPQEVSATLSRLLDRYDTARAAAGDAATDATILASMLGAMKRIRSHGVDFTNPRIRP